VKTILSIDGGGMRGYVPCAILVELERRAGKSCADIFDLVSGTSIGGILACLIATGKSATEALKFFTEDGPKIFGHQQLLGRDGILEPRYSNVPIETCLMDRLGTATLANCKGTLLVPAFDLVAYEPIFFKSNAFDKPYPLWQVARATSAAQTYFPAYEMDGKILWDGGNVANNPTACAVAEAVRIYGRTEPLRILSLGCGSNSSKVTPSKLVNAGLAAVGIETIGLLFDANDELPDYILRQVLPEGYFRIQPKLAQSLSIDGSNAEAIQALKDAATASIATFSGTIDDFLASSPKLTLGGHSSN
jgi:uncharacterized protein